jgi:glycosyltransferase involved in cell wall biosynthesis
MITLSIVIPARSEFPSIVFTVYSIIHCLEAEGFTYKDFEIIIVDNASADDVYPQRGTAGTTSYLEGRGIYYNAVLRVLRDPIAGNHSARNKGAEIARGKYLFFSDAHMSYQPGFFKEMMRTVDESDGLFHGTIAWLGAYPPDPRGLGYSYTIKLGEEWKGTWNNYKLADDWWYIPSQGHCSVGVKRDQFFRFGGYPKVHRTYGGGEFYMDMKWWMFGSSVVVNPKCVGYHLSSARGYSYNHTDYIENVLGCTYALGCDDWRERTYINAIRSKNKKDVDAAMARNLVEYAPDREFVEKNRKFTFNELLVNKPWDQKNQERHGKSNGAILVYHWTWMQLLLSSPVALDAYRNSKHQKELSNFIETNLKEFIYLNNNFKDEDLIKLKGQVYGETNSNGNTG